MKQGNSAAIFEDKCKTYFLDKVTSCVCSTPLIEDELNRLQQLGIITPVNFSEWAAPIVAVRKASGKVRICGEYSSGINAS